MRDRTHELRQVRNWVRTPWSEEKRGRAGALGEDSWFWVRDGWLMAKKENPGSPWFLRDENRSEQAVPMTPALAGG